MAPFHLASLRCLQEAAVWSHQHLTPSHSGMTSPQQGSEEGASLDAEAALDDVLTIEGPLEMAARLPHALHVSSITEEGVPKLQVCRCSGVQTALTEAGSRPALFISLGQQGGAWALHKGIRVALPAAVCGTRNLKIFKLQEGALVRCVGKVHRSVARMRHVWGGWLARVRTQEAFPCGVSAGQAIGLS